MKRAIYTQMYLYEFNNLVMASTIFFSLYTHIYMSYSVDEVEGDGGDGGAN
jgi:hypothetical protein